MRVPLVYHDAPIFGLDIGSRSVKLAQLAKAGRGVKVLGYGYAGFPADSIVEGIIAEPDAVAKAIKAVITHPTAGKITARRIASSLPVARVFTRILDLPPMSPTDLEQAVRFEAEQSVPVGIDDIYIDYETIGQSRDSKNPDHTEVLMVAAPRAIVDSYVKLFDSLGLEIGSVETSLEAITRAMNAARHSNTTSLVIDFGSRAVDLAIYDRVIRLTGTVGLGGDDLTSTLVKQLGISSDHANEIKYKFGIGDSGLKTKVVTALAPQLATVVTEIKKLLKYYHDRSQPGGVQSVLLSGGSASMPGLIDYLYQEVGIPINIGNPWINLTLKSLKPVAKLEAPMYATAIGLALHEVER